MGEDVITLGLYTLRDFNHTERGDIKQKDHLFCITYLHNQVEKEVLLIWKRGKIIFTRSLHHDFELPKDTTSLMYYARLVNAASRILDGEKVNLLEI